MSTDAIETYAPANCLFCKRPTDAVCRILSPGTCIWYHTGDMLERCEQIEDDKCHGRRIVPRDLIDFVVFPLVDDDIDRDVTISDWLVFFVGHWRVAVPIAVLFISGCIYGVRWLFWSVTV
jgi:hypothetical protein